ncbi:MAG: RNA polymerase sigma-70 factor, partial [Clostridiales bacterium]|nr:RNA polymerase sigma-70 factor [Clostridiales bacterium]
IKGLKAGDNSAYGYLYGHYYKMLCFVAFGYVNDTFVSEMIVSDVIFDLWKNRKSLDISSSLRNYLIRSIRNRCLNYLAQSERQQALRMHIGEKIELEQIDEINTPDNPLTQLIEKELEKKIDDSIEALPELTRKIFCLSRFENRKYDEIAREMNVSVDVVKYHIKSALAQLRTKLKDYLILLFAFLSFFRS